MGIDLGLAGKTAIVVGAGKDVGRATAAKLVEAGARVVLVGRNSDSLEATAATLGNAATVAPLDLSDSASVEALVRAVLDRHGRIDLLANTAGAFPMKALTGGGPGPMFGDDESWEEAFQNVFMGAARLMRGVLPVMKEQGSGAVVHLGSNSARDYSAFTGQFAAMKAALSHAVKNWARDGAPHGVRVNAVHPGWIRGDRIEEQITSTAAQPGKDMASVEKEMMGGHGLSHYWSQRMGKPEEYAGAILFLLSDLASYVNGAMLPVDGGSSSWG